MVGVALLVGFLIVVYVVVLALIFLRKKMEKNRKKKAEGGERGAAVFAAIAAHEEGFREGGTRKKRIIRGERQGEASLWKTSGRIGRKTGRAEND